jgi:hypothetical protein
MPKQGSPVLSTWSGIIVLLACSMVTSVVILMELHAAPWSKEYQ